MSSKSPSANPNAKKLLGYLQHHLPDYPFDPVIDAAFVDELVADFADKIDVLEEVKSFRWYYSQQPTTKMRSVRLGLRRWIANAKPRRPR